ncbi:MAG: DUF748 domain-containing protein [Holophagales bacterium]|nr:DUF748 domain-containing protein [Holophagales bacterium]
MTLDYVQAKAGSAEPSAAATPPPATAAAKAKGPPPPEPEWAIRMDKILISSSELGFVNREKDPGFRAYFSRLEGSISDLGNRASGARAYYDLSGRFLGSGETKLTGSFREGSENPDFDANLRIESTDMTLMNDLLRSYGKFDVVAGRFSFYSELKARDGNIEGYVKPLFKGMDVYDRRQDRDKSVFRKGYEMLVGGVAGLLRNSERKQVATVATVSGRLDEPDTSGWQIAVRLVGNAFFQSILPGFDRELERLPAKGRRMRNDPLPARPFPPPGRAGRLNWLSCSVSRSSSPSLQPSRASSPTRRGRRSFPDDGDGPDRPRRFRRAAGLCRVPGPSGLTLPPSCRREDGPARLTRTSGPRSGSALPPI